MLTSKSVETLIDLVEIKLSCLEVWDREDAKERKQLDIALKELMMMRTGTKRAIPANGAEITTLHHSNVA